MKCVEIFVMCFYVDDFSEIICNMLICVFLVYMCICLLYLYSIYINIFRNSILIFL